MKKKTKKKMDDQPTSPRSPNQQLQAQLARVYGKALDMNFLHHDSARVADRMWKCIALPNRIVASLVGSGSLLHLLTEDLSSVGIAIASLTVLASILSATESFTRFGERAQRHKEYGARFNHLVNDIEFAQASCRADKLFLQRVGSLVTNFSNGSSPDIFARSERALAVAKERRPGSVFTPAISTPVGTPTHTGIDANTAIEASGLTVSVG